MLISVGYLIVYLYERYRAWRQGNMGYADIIARHVRHATLVFRAVAAEPALSQQTTRYSPLVSASAAGWLENSLFTRNGKQALVLSPKMKVELDGWVSYLVHKTLLDRQEDETDGIYVLLETAHPDNEEDFLERSFSIPQDKLIKVVDCVSPVAWKSGVPFGILAECDESQLSKLCTAFIEGRLMLDDLLELTQIITVEVEGKPSSLLNIQLGNEVKAAAPKGLSPYHGWDYVLDDLHSSNVDLGSNYQDSNESLASGVDSTIQEFLASDQSVEDFDKMTDTSAPQADDQVSNADSMSDIIEVIDGGEGPSGPVADLAPEMLTPVHRKAVAASKPPNILIYCGKKDSQRQFDSVKVTIQHCINQERYVIYQLKHDQVHTTPWAENTVLLIISSEKVYDGVDQAFLQYFLNGGLVASFGSVFDELFTNKVITGGTASVMPLTYKNWRNVTTICTRHQYDRDTPNKLDNVSLHVLSRDTARGNPVILEANHTLSGAAAVLAQVNLDKDASEMAISPEIFAALKKANASRCAILRDLLTLLGLDTESVTTAPLTPALLLTTSQEQRDRFTETIKKRCKDNMLRSRLLTIEFIKTGDTAQAQVDRLPLVLTSGNTVDAASFNFAEYKSHLTSKALGHTVIYTPIISSTMPVIDCLMLCVSEEQGLVVVAGQQTQGKGRGANAWLSPHGCLMFSFHLRLTLSSPLGQSLGLLQHMAALSVVHGIRQHTPYQDVDIRLKWPNDIYFGNKMKLGGILVQSSIMGDTVHMNIGIGINVKNKNPTVCVNDLVEQVGRERGETLPPLSLEQVLAYSLSSMEHLVSTHQAGNASAVFDLYYKYWLHSDARVFVESLSQNVDIIGLDSQGYLQVKAEDGSTYTLQPDGNSFDMMKNLISMKTT